MPDETTLRIFISSPSDVRPERLKAEQIVHRLDREFAYHFRVRPVLWEREPLVATHHYQHPKNIPYPRHMDIVVVVLWSQLGVLLPEGEFRGALSGRAVTGTEWEFEDALMSAQERGVPELLLYRKTARITADLDDDAALTERRAQRSLVQDFVGRWFRTEDGEGFTAASHSFTTTAEFEQQLYSHLRELLERRAGVSAAGVTIRWHKAPFRALLSYEYEHAQVFFGRTRARHELREMLVQQIQRGTAFVLVFGASGSGKSSLVKAGLLPDLTLPGMVGRVGLVRRALVRPSDAGGDLLAALAAAIMSPTALPELAALQYTPERLAGLLREAPGQAALPIHQGLAVAGKEVPLTGNADARLVVVVDQFEEIFTIDTAGDEDRRQFTTALDALAKSGAVWVIATMRSDFFDRLATVPVLAALSADSRFLLLPPEDAEIGQMIREPALEAGLRFERDAASGMSLDEEIRRAAAKDRNALPLLSFLLDQLWQRRTEGGVLTFARYRELGGLEGAIGNRAEDIFSGQSEGVRDELVPLLRGLVTIERGRAVSRAAPLSRFQQPPARRALVDAFLDDKARLLVSSGGAGYPQLRLAHEALLSHWKRAERQVDEDARDLELSGQLEQEAAAWRAATKRDKKHRVRVRAGKLALNEARTLLKRWPDQLPVEVVDFIAAAHREAWAQRRRLWAMILVPLPAISLVALIVWAGLVWHGVQQVEAEMKFVPIKPGCFEMGSAHPEGVRSINEQPHHNVCLKAFDLGQYEVTRDEWRRVMIFPNDVDPAFYKHDEHPPYHDDEQLPVDGVSWREAERFVWLMSLFGHHKYRLPSEAEWEYAARAGTTTSRFWGDNPDDGCTYANFADQARKKSPPPFVSSFAQCNDGYVGTAPVGSFKHNPWMLYDMLGNVMNWVEDCYSPNYKGAPVDGSANMTGLCAAHSIRGGSYKSMPQDLYVAYRYDNEPNVRLPGVGLRVAWSDPP